MPTFEDIEHVFEEISAASVNRYFQDHFHSFYHTNLHYSFPLITSFTLLVLHCFLIKLSHTQNCRYFPLSEDFQRLGKRFTEATATSMGFGSVL